VHASLLPRYRGAAPVHRAVIGGDRETGVTIMKMVKALDAGPMLAAARYPIGPDETSEEVERALGQLGAQLLVATVDALAAGPVAEVPQDDAAATYAQRISKDDGVVDWTQPAIRIHDLIRGLYPWPHAFTFYRGRRLILLGSVVEKGGRESLPGTILHADGEWLQVATGDGTLAITRIQAEGRRPMTTREFLAGHPLAAGEILTPHP
jgi:methionyl-tRNA formyltransferase